MVCFLLSHINCNILYQNEVKLFTMVWRETMVIVDNRVWGFSKNMRFGVPWVRQMYFYQNFCPWYICLYARLERESYLNDFHQIWNKHMNYSSRPINQEKVVVWNILKINHILAQKLMEIDFNFVRKLYQTFWSNLGQKYPLVFPTRWC